MTDQIRNQFPALSGTVYGKPLVYLDNAATSQRPRSVMDCWSSLVSGANANIHRAVHHLAGLATDAYEDSRRAVQAFLNASAPEEIVFTSGATAAVNLVAFSFGEAFVKEGDEVLVTVAEHHSDIVPWQLLCKRKMPCCAFLTFAKTAPLRWSSWKIFFLSALKLWLLRTFPMC